MSGLISRRDFLKLLGYGAIAISSGLFLHLGRFGDISQRYEPSFCSGQRFLGNGSEYYSGSHSCGGTTKRKDILSCWLSLPSGAESWPF